MKKKKLLFIPFFLFVFLFIIAFRPIMNPSLEDCQKLIGTITSVEAQDQTQDIYFKMVGDPVQYYVNRGMTQHGLSSLLSDYEGQEVIIYSVNHWTPLDFTSSTKHIARIEIGNKIIYDETA